MVSLNTSLDSIGVSQARGVGAPMLRDQLKGTLPKATADAATGSRTGQLTPEQQRQIARLQETDRRVHDHEQAHMRAGAGLITSGPSYTYTYGPDGKAYATGGEVGIDTSPEKKPQANIDKGRRIVAAALAPADPSAQDYRVAEAGGRLEASGRQELSAEQRAQRSTELTAGRVNSAYAAGAGNTTGSSVSLYA